MGDALFAHIVESPGGVTLSEHEYSDWRSFLKTSDRKIHLAIPRLLDMVAGLDAARAELEALAAEYPFMLAAGERRSYNANTILRDPEWRKDDPDGALRMNPADAQRLGVDSGVVVRGTSHALVRLK